MQGKASSSITEGEVTWKLPGNGEEVRTWYKVVGDLENSHQLPLVALHGGPGAGHNYISPMADLHSKFGVPVVLYDQVGCGRSTHLRSKTGDEGFWTENLFVHELDTIVDHLKIRQRGFNVWGSSWGGMLAGVYASRRPEGLQKIVIASGPCDMKTYLECVNKLLSELPDPIRQTLEDCDKRGDIESPEYEAASLEFIKRHVCRVDPLPDDVMATFNNLKEDPSTVYMTMQGPSEFRVIGNLKNWEATSRAHNITAKVLLTNGRYDEAQNSSMEGWSQKIPNVEWVVFEDSSHTPFWEEREHYMDVVGRFLIGPALIYCNCRDKNYDI
ncbi:proline-specific peptidase [Lophiotrema nucula]|uniref:Proline-specific peptidase n=1 Tax=Lophiotrema nucula TaxID=690887 RepID=A0A6A5YNI6_9PLEO|nr:proline-specific peptidase [Lophiotrema nucula]